MRARRSFLLALVMSLAVVSIAQGGNVGKVAGQILNYDAIGEGLLPRIVSLLNENKRLNVKLEKDGTFMFFNVVPGRYYIMTGESIILQPEFEVFPDLTTRITTDYANPRLFRGEGKIQLGRYRALRTINLKHSSMIHPDKTFSGSVIFSEEERSARTKPLELSFRKYGRLRGYVTPSATVE